ncbi:Inner membrane protein YqiK [Olavius algarvensis associated proteobacterium Delta 3]|nr:Inner membrane protein YqiK [Olavius algarvensis associated proteobacterium Delta 3]CAB5136299.1 Inner membrane protein YqiK [Olavius algarvensis associated proteobacterium Delta 3]
MTIYGWVILVVVTTIIVIAVGIWFMRSFYRRSSKEIAFVRTGLGGQKVVIDGACFVFPIFHDVTEVYLNTLRLSVVRDKEDALISKDRMRVDVAVDFYIRVRKDPESVTVAAQTLGRKTGKPDELREMMSGKFVDALRATAAGMNLEMLHEERSRFVQSVGQAVAESLTKNGFELESASLIDLDQTDMEYFNPSNAVDAEGLTHLTDEIEQRKKTRNDIEQDTLIQIRTKNLETEQLSLDIERESEYARLAQEKELEFRRAAQQADLVRERAERKRDAQVADIMANEQIEKSRIASDLQLKQDRIEQERDIEAMEIERRKSIELAEHTRIVAVAQSSEAETAARARADTERAKAIHAEEAIFTARETAQADRKKQVELILTALAVEKDQLRQNTRISTEKAVAAEQAEIARIEAEAFAESEKTRSKAWQVRNQVQSEGVRLMAEANNIASPEARTSALRLRLVDKLDAIIRESVKPMEKIEGIKVVHLDGLTTPTGGGSSDSEGGLTDRLVSSALRYRAQAPIVDALLDEIGIDAGDPTKIARLLGDLKKDHPKEDKET